FYSPYTSGVHFDEIVVFLIVLCALAAFSMGLLCGRARNYAIVGTDDEKGNKKIIFYLVAAGLISYALYVNIYGGWGYVLENISKIRSGTDDNKNYLGAIFKMFSYYLDVALYTYIGLMIAKGKSSSGMKALLIVLLFLVLGRAFLGGGRQQL